MKKNILFVVDERKMGGVSVLLGSILNKINIKKYCIDLLILHNNGNYLEELPREVNIIYGSSFFETVDLSIKDVLKMKKVRLMYSKIRLIFLMKTKLINKKIKKERKKILSKKYDVEIAFKDGFCAVFTAYGDSKKKYHWLHIDYSMYDCTSKYKKLFDDVFLKFDKIVAISQSVLEKFKAKYNAISTDVIYNVVDSNNIIEKSYLETINFNKKDLNLICVGRIHSVKGYDRLVDIMNDLNKNKKLNNVILRIIGDGPDFQLLDDKIKKYKLEKKVILLGQKSNPYPYVKASDCFIMCSYNEGFGLVVVESLILKVPVISCNVASINEIMNDDYGLIVDNSYKGLYDGLLKIIDNKDILEGKKRRLEEYQYDIKKIIKQIESLLDE